MRDTRPLGDELSQSDGGGVGNAGDLAGAVAHHLAAALLSRFVDGVPEEKSVADLAGDLQDARDDALVPVDVATLCRRVGTVPGVNLGGVLARCAAPDELQQALADLNAKASVAVAGSESFAAVLAMEEPLIAGIVAARDGNADAAAYVDSYLSPDDESEDDELLTALRHVRQGNLDSDTAHLDSVNRAIIARACDAVAGRAEIDVNLWPAVSLGPLMLHVVRAVTNYSAGSAAAARQKIAEYLTEPTDAALAAVLDQILGGNHNPDLADELDDPTDRAILATVLHYIDG